MMQKLSEVATIEENAVDEVVDVCGIDVMLSYTNRKTYTMDGEELANCDDLPDMPKDATKAVLIARTETILN